MAESIVRRFRNCMAWIDSRRARKRRRCCRKADLLSKTEPHENNVGFSERSEVPIEPRLSEQWFLRYPKTKEALAVVRDHLIRFFPVHWEKVYAQWLENIQDWCISRQIWWGHRIPAWYRGIRNRSAVKPESKVYVGLEPPGDAENWTQDPDTLDTWFSSWLWAYETMDDGDAKEVLSDVCSRHRAGHYFFLGRAHDHRRAGIQAGQNLSDRRQYSVSRCFFHRADSRQTGSQDVEVVRQLARSARLDRKVWRGRIALWT